MYTHDIFFSGETDTKLHVSKINVANIIFSFWWYQILLVLVLDWKACANNLDCSSQCVQAYMARYHHYSGCSNSCQSFARIHNGGPRGCRHSNTAGYWRRVQAQGCN